MFCRSRFQDRNTRAVGQLDRKGHLDAFAEMDPFEREMLKRTIWKAANRQDSEDLSHVPREEERG